MNGSTVVLQVGDFYIEGLTHRKILNGWAIVLANVIVDKADDLVTQEVTYNEVADAHDCGATVFEMSDAFVGMWRQLEV